MSKPVHVAVLIVAYNGREHLHECLSTVLASDDGELQREIIVVDNASTDGSADFVEQYFPQVYLLRLSTNSGFCGGNNRGWTYCLQRWPGLNYVALLNQDTAVASGWLRALTSYLEAHANVGSAQAKLLLHERLDRFNSAGNESHFLGFGFVTGLNEVDVGQFDQPREIAFASGAACVVRVNALRDEPLFDERFFNYLEDADLGWTLREQGFATHYVPTGVVWHKYAFKDDYRNYFALERNRLWLVLSHYKKRTLLLLMPALLMMEAGQCVFAIGQGVLREKFRSYAAVFGRRGLQHLCERRRAIRSRRTVGDRELTKHFTGHIRFGALQSPLVKFVASPLLGTYWAIARRLILW